jgi:hypothetical protein
MVLALVLAAALPQPAAAQDQPGTQAVILCPIPVGEALNGVDVCVDRGDGAVYYEGDPITICATWNIPQIAIFPPPPPPTIRVTDSVNGSTGRLLFEESSPSGQRCVSGAIGAPFGSETSLGEAIATDGRVFATDTATFTSIPRGSDTMVDVSVTVDRGSNSSYRPGDPITICATVTSPFGGSYPVRLVDTINGQHYATFDLGSFAGVRCFPFMVVPPTGQEDLRAEVVDPQTGAVLDTGTVTIFIVA